MATPKPALVTQPPIATVGGFVSVVVGSSRTRPLWFDGRLLTANDMERDQNYFLQQQAALARAAGFGVIHGLTVDTVASGGTADAETLIVRAGQGLTPSGRLVMISQDLTVRLSDLAEEQNLETQFGIAENATPVERTRTGLYVLALRAVQFTANPVASYPSSIQSSRRQDGDTVEATAVSLVPYPDPAGNLNSQNRDAALARQIFVAGDKGALADSLLPLAMVSLQRGAIEWIDIWLVRRDSAPASGALRLGLSDPVVQQAFLLQYDAQLQNAVNGLRGQNLPASFPATDYFQALPPAGRFPLDGIDVIHFTQIFFPPQSNVRLCLVPEDELPSLIEDSLSLAPIDLTLPAAGYADLSILALVPAPRPSFASLAPTLPCVTLTSASSQVASAPKPLDLLRLFRGAVPQTGNSGNSSGWQSAIGSLTYGYYVRRRSSPLLSSSTTVNAALSPDNTSLAVTVAVLPSSATGNISLQDGVSSLGTLQLTNGRATVVIAGVTPGQHTLVASYNGDGFYAPSTSPAITVNVPAPTTRAATTTALTGSLSSDNTTLSLAAAVSPPSATGTITVQDGTTVAAIATLSQGAATLTISPISPGPHSLVALYSGDANFAVSASASFAITVPPAKIAVTIQLLLSTGPIAGRLNLTAVVTPSSATGSITFQQGATVLGTEPLANGSAKLQLTTDKIPPSGIPITLQYSGDANFSPVTVGPIMVGGSPIGGA